MNPEGQEPTTPKLTRSLRGLLRNTIASRAIMEPAELFQHSALSMNLPVECDGDLWLPVYLPTARANMELEQRYGAYEKFTQAWCKDQVDRGIDKLSSWFNQPPEPGKPVQFDAITLLEPHQIVEPAMKETAALWDELAETLVNACKEAGQAWLGNTLYVRIPANPTAEERTAIHTLYEAHAEDTAAWLLGLPEEERAKRAWSILGVLVEHMPPAQQTCSLKSAALVEVLQEPAEKFYIQIKNSALRPLSKIFGCAVDQLDATVIQRLLDAQPRETEQKPITQDA